MLTVVMYHYVRELERSFYKGIKGLSVQGFKRQLEWFKSRYVFVTTNLVIDAYHGGAKLPKNSILLTFDDGYADHYRYVYPILDSMGITGAFFPPVTTIRHHKVLDVNKIHFILASIDNKSDIVKMVFDLIRSYSSEYNLLAPEQYYEQYAHANRFDPAEVIFIKRILQMGLPHGVRSSITQTLFDTYVTSDEAGFAEELYLTTDQIQCMVRGGMTFGNHGGTHVWLNTLKEQDQKAEIQDSLNMLQSLGVDMEKWSMCYPYGAYNDTTLSLVKQFGGKIGFTTQVSLANESTDPLQIPRMDTNDFPQ
ncbi:polysaccharide deacetylase family protein [Alicyclobacillus ferrooxydans]|uniref:NodB homology domain-containing protein n=1 Tax=Alicyclobacillus ferrooxydans TaxID=471514 RepID=A0A0P9CZB2_9BACL|nr:polysaccharide deacetylase family protein [Alicyclobacillus ferrooxydans]KPV42388.1 hypothetical protein AN477_17415 [Alicyclobacillus ferrooxydans]